MHLSDHLCDLREILGSVVVVKSRTTCIARLASFCSYLSSSSGGYKVDILANSFGQRCRKNMRSVSVHKGCAVGNERLPAMFIAIKRFEIGF